jgi:hypothetical protein
LDKHYYYYYYYYYSIWRERTDEVAGTRPWVGRGVNEVQDVLGSQVILFSTLSNPAVSNTVYYGSKVVRLKSFNTIAIDKHTVTCGCATSHGQCQVKEYQ